MHIMLILFLLTGMIVQSHALFHVKSMQTIKGPSDLNEESLFGYSISYQPKLRRLIVSAPKANDIGKIYLIDINSSDVTNVRIPLKRWTPESIKHDFWSGATVKANSDYYMACIPRYAEWKTNLTVKANDQKPATVGLCFVKPSDGKVYYLKTITNADRNLYTQFQFKKLMDSFGWSIDVTPQKELLIGSPVPNRGRVLRYAKVSKSVTPQLIHDISYKNPVSYNFGYSVASGKFFSNQISYAVSTTFGEIGFGKVYFFNTKLKNIGAINDDELGSMFGAALCSANLGGVALLIGAPVFADGDYAYDVGAVYIYMGSSGSNSNEMSLKRKLVGKSNGAYFGNAIVSLGDMDGDSKDEIAIAAPYDDDGKGAVYIYTGEGILQAKILQKIQPEGFLNFGHSLTVVEDYDNNGYNDLAVSSPKNNTIILFRSVAPITVNLYTKFPNLQEHANKTFFEFQSCLDIVHPEKPKGINADLMITVITTDSISKLVQADKNGTLTYEVHLKDDSSYCRNIAVKSVLTPVTEYNQVIAYKITAALKDNPLEGNDFDISRVILSERSVLETTGSEWTSDCGGKTCVPILKHEINSSLTKPYIIGSSNKEMFTISVQNIGQTAYGACAVVTILEARVLQRPPGCTLIKDNKQFLCNRIEPLRNGGIWNIDPIEIEATQLTSENDRLTINTDLYNNCNNKTDKTAIETVYDYLQGDYNRVTINGQANPEETVNMTRNDVYRLGKNMEHVYTINNNGKTNWIGVKSKIILENVPFLNYSGTPITISKDKSSGIECSMMDSNWTESQISVLCDIGDLRRHQKAVVVIAISIPPNTLDFKEENENVTATTTFILLLNDHEESLNLTTTLRFITAPVALWIIIASSVVGLVILVVISFALYECGFLRRKNKDKLRVLKREVHRQSMHRSIMRESMRAAANRRSTEEYPFTKSIVEQETIDDELLSELKNKIQ